MTANQSFIASMVSLVAAFVGLYGIGRAMDWYEARERERQKPKP